MKPEKKYSYEVRNDYDAGYSQCYDEWEEWLKEFLPSEEEIEKICEKVVCKDYRYKKDIAKAISKRLEIK